MIERESCLTEEVMMIEIGVKELQQIANGLFEHITSDRGINKISPSLPLSRDLDLLQKESASKHSS